MCLYPDLAFIWIFHQGYVHQIKNGDILQLGGQCAIGTRQNGGRICWREATQRGQFLLPYQFYQIVIIQEGNGERGRKQREVQIKFLLAVLLAKMETSHANSACGEIVSHDVYHFHALISIPS